MGLPWFEAFLLSSKMKFSSLDRRMRVTVAGSIYTGSRPSATFLSFLEKCSRSSRLIFLFRVLICAIEEI